MGIVNREQMAEMNFQNIKLIYVCLFFSLLLVAVFFFIVQSIKYAYSQGDKTLI